MMVPAHKRKFPQILADRLSFALHVTRPLGDQATAWLAIYRENIRQSIAAGGLNANFKGVGNGIPAEHLAAIQRLHEAFEELHRYRGGWASDYVSANVESEINSARASVPRERTRKADYTAVAAHLRSKSYSERKNKKGLVLEAMGLFGISERTVYKIAAQYGQTKVRKKTTAT